MEGLEQEIDEKMKEEEKIVAESGVLACENCSKSFSVAADRTLHYMMYDRKCDGTEPL